MSPNKGLSDCGECSRSIHGVKRDWPPNDVTEGGDGLAVLPWPLPPILPQFVVNNNGLCHSDNHLCLPPLQPYPYATLFNSRLSPLSQFDYLNDDDLLADRQFQIISDALGMPELGKMTAQEIMDAKALAASKSHSVAERRRRERINNHLAKLRSLLPSTTKTDKASLLTEVIQHLKELKLQTSLIAETISIPTENDELSVDPAEDNRGHMVRASLCCEDRSDLLPDLIKALKALRLRTSKAEITSLSGRIRYILIVKGEEDLNQGNNYTEHQQQWHRYSVSSIQEGLKAVIEKGGGGTRDESYTGNVKRQRTNTGKILEPGSSNHLFGTYEYKQHPS